MYLSFKIIYCSYSIK